MKYLKQFVIILMICLVGELIVHWLPFAFPGNIMAMIILVLLLTMNVIKESAIKETSDYLLSMLGLILVPASVAVIEHLELVGQIGLQILLITTIILVVAFVSCAYTIRLTMKVMNGLKRKGDMR